MKKLLAICLSVLLLCAAMPFAFATAADEAVIVVSDVEGKAGETVAVTISLKNNPGIVSAKIGVGYDASALELVLDPEDDAMPSVEYGTFHMGGYSFGPVANNPFVVNWCYAIGKNYTDENLITLQFKIKDGAAAGTYPLTLTYDCDEDFYNKAWDTIYFSADEGSVTVVEDEPIVPDVPDVPDEPVYTEPTIVLPNFEAKAGDEIAVKVSLKNNPGIVSAKIGVGYDASALELVLDPEDDAMPSVEYGAFHMGGYSFGPVANNPFVVNWCYTIGKNYADEDLITLKFKVKDDAVSGTYPLTLTYDCDEDFYNKAWETIYFAAVEGSVTVKGDAPIVPPVEECEHSYESDCDPICDLCGESRPVHTEGIVHIDAVDAGCHYIGNIEYWYCPACEMFWQDAELTQITNSKNVILPAIGSENVEHVEAVAPTCNSEGNIEYWHCADCDQYWQDEALTQLTNVKNVILGMTEHNIIHIDAVAPGCHYLGNIEYWFCSICEMFWQDAELTQLTNSKNVLLPAIGGDVIAFEAVEPGCHYIGNIAYWFCPECEQFWQDEALTQLTNSKNVILPATGGENVEHVEAVAPTCYSDGNIEYWHCADCDQYWQDEALTQLTNVKNVILGTTEHNIVHIEAVAPGCHYIGNIEYWYCSICEMFWQDAELTQITNSKNVILPAVGGDVVAFEAVEPGCHYIGNIAYWFCPECEQFWQDEALTQLTNSKNVILPAIGSENVEHVEAKDPTCLETGNIEYWYCADCDQYWQDEALTQLTNSKNVLIAPVEHTIVHIEAVAPGCHYIGNIEYWYCSACEMFWQDAELTQITNSKNVILPALGGDVVAFEAVEPGCHYIGNIAYWYCPECEQFWQDEALTQLTNSKNVILPAIGSENVEHVEAKDPTCLETGNIEYWHCADCDQYWADAALTQLTNSKNVLIAPVDHTIVHIEAVAPGCHYIGNIEYWYCTVCEMFWQNAELTQITNSNNVILPAAGSENLQHVEAKEPVGHENGNIEYWFCPDCEQYWQDEALTQITNVKNVIIANTNVKYVIATDATEYEAGNKAHWYCSDCGKYFLDAELTQETTKEEITIPATGADEPVNPDSPETGDSTVAVVVALLTLIVSGVAVSVLKNKKRA